MGAARSKGTHHWILSHQAREGDDAKEVVDGDDIRREEGEGALIAWKNFRRCTYIAETLAQMSDQTDRKPSLLAQAPMVCKYDATRDEARYCCPARHCLSIRALCSVIPRGDGVNASKDHRLTASS